MMLTVRKAIVHSLLWLLAIWLLLPSLSSCLGRSSTLCFAPLISTDFNCIFMEAHARASFANPWLSRSTPIEYLRLRYTPHAEDQEYGIMFVDPRNLAFEAHCNCVSAPTNLSGQLNSAAVVRDWIGSQPQSSPAESHDGDAQQLYQAILASVNCDLEHFVVPSKPNPSHFRVTLIGANRAQRELLYQAVITVLGLFGAWWPVLSIKLRAPSGIK